MSQTDSNLRRTDPLRLPPSQRAALSVLALAVEAVRACHPSGSSVGVSALLELCVSGKADHRVLYSRVASANFDAMREALLQLSVPDGCGGPGAPLVEEVAGGKSGHTRLRLTQHGLGVRRGILETLALIAVDTGP